MKGTKKGRDVNEFIGLDMKILGRVCDKLEWIPMWGEKGSMHDDENFTRAYK